MSGQVIRRMVMVLWLAVAATGCATKERERITLLEETNVDLTDRLNRSQSELDGAFSDSEELDRLLQAALDDLSALQEQLSERPVPEEAAPGWTATPGGAMIAIDDAVLFATGKAALRQEARRTLDAVVNTLLGEYGDKDILVFGHTDDQPIKKSGWTDNYQLSSERALAVTRYLREQGVSAARLVACGCGEFRPRVDNASDANRATNRRVEIFAVDSLKRTGQT